MSTGKLRISETKQPLAEVQIIVSKGKSETKTWDVLGERKVQQWDTCSGDSQRTESSVEWKRVLQKTISLRLELLRKSSGSL